MDFQGPGPRWDPEIIELEREIREGAHQFTRAEIEHYIFNLGSEKPRISAVERLVDLQPASWLVWCHYPLPSGAEYIVVHIVYDEGGKLRLVGRAEVKDKQ